MVLIPALILTLFWDTLGHQFSTAYYEGKLSDKLWVGPSPGSYDSSLICFIGNVFFLQTIFVSPFGINGPLWSLANEFWYYALFPCLYLCVFGSNKFVKLMHLTVAVALMFWLPAKLLLLGVVWVLGYGVVLAHSHTLIMKFANTNWFRLAAAGSLMAAMLLSRKAIVPELIEDYLVGMTCAAVILSVLDWNWGPTFYRLASKALSDISYTLYLAHVPLLVFASTALYENQQLPFTLRSVTIFAMALLLSVFYATVLYLLFERNTIYVRNWFLRNDSHAKKLPG